MSYILDALKKVQPERQPEVLVQTPPVVVQYAEPDWQPRLLRLALWLVVVAALLLLAAIGWRWYSQQPSTAEHQPLPAPEVSQPSSVAPAPTTARAPMRRPWMIVAPLPTKASSSMVIPPHKVAPGAIWTFLPIRQS